MAGIYAGLKKYSQERLKSAFKNGELEAVSDLTRHGTQEVRHSKTGKQFTVSVESPNRSVVTSENREEFMKKKLKLADKEQEVLDDSHGIEKHDPKISTEYKLTDFPATVGKLSYQSPSSDDEKKFDNHKVFDGATHLYTVGKEAIDSDKYIAKHKKTGDIDNFPSKEHAFRHISKKHKRK